MATIVRKVQDAGSPSQSDTIRTLIHRMRESGDLERRDRGLYQLPAAERVTDTAVTKLKARTPLASGGGA
jgi:hypothetical protein